jgi:hypothetical protein
MYEFIRFRLRIDPKGRRRFILVAQIGHSTRPHRTGMSPGYGGPDLPRTDLCCGIHALSGLSTRVDSIRIRPGCTLVQGMPGSRPSFPVYLEVARE